MASGSSNRRDGKGGATSDAQRARALLNDGDFALARKIAQSVLAGDATEPDKKEAREILDATTIDRGPMLLGLAVFLVLAVLFTWALTHHHAS
jgi:hypothetical protein